MISRLGDYLLAETLGTGAFGNVRRAVHQPTDRQFAIKIMEKALIHNQELTLNVRREIAIMKAFTHPNIVSVHNVLTSKTKVYVVLDLVRGPELFEVIAKRGPGGLPEKEARKYFQHLIDGVDYCHRRGVCHRDLKPENLLIDNDGTLRITDFGLSSMKGANTTTDLLTTQCGTPNYIAPEIISCANPRYDGQKVDAWACGIILYALLAGYLPFDETDLAHLFEVIQKGHFEFPHWISAGAKDLIWRLLSVDPHVRASVHDVKQHPWFLANYQPSQPSRMTVGAGKRRRRRDRGSSSLDDMGYEGISVSNDAHRYQSPELKSTQAKPSPTPPMLSLDIPSLQLPPIQTHLAPQNFAHTPSQTSVAAAETARTEMLRSHRAMSFSKRYSLLRKGVVTYGRPQVGLGSFCDSKTLGGEQQARMRGVLSGCSSSLSTSQGEQASPLDRTNSNKNDHQLRKMKTAGHENEQQDTIQAIQSLRNIISACKSKRIPATEVGLDYGAEDNQRRELTLKALRKLRDELRSSELKSSSHGEDHFLRHNQRKDTIRLLDVWESRLLSDLRNEEECDDTRVTEQEISAFQSLLQTWETHLGGEDFIEDVLIPGSEAVEDESPATIVLDDIFDRSSVLRKVDLSRTANRNHSLDNRDSPLEMKGSSNLASVRKHDEPCSAKSPHLLLQKASQNSGAVKPGKTSSDDGSDLAKLWNHVLVTNTSNLNPRPDGPLNVPRQDKSPFKDLIDDDMSSPVTDCNASPSSTKGGAPDVVVVRQGRYRSKQYSKSQTENVKFSNNENPNRPRSPSEALETARGKHRALPESENLQNGGEHSYALKPVKSHDFVVEPPFVRSPAQRQIRVDSVSSRHKTQGRSNGVRYRQNQTKKESRSGPLHTKMDHLKQNGRRSGRIDSLLGVTRRYNFLSIRSKYSSQFESGLEAKVCLRELGRLMEIEGIDVSRRHGQKALRVRIPVAQGNNGIAASFDFHGKGDSGTVVHIKRVGGDRSMSRNEADMVLSKFVSKILARFSELEPGLAVLPGRA